MPWTGRSACGYGPLMPSIVPSLPPGYHSRPANAHNIPTIHALVAACEREVHGRVQSDAGAIAADLSRPGLMPESDTVLVLDRAGRLAAWAWVDRRSVVDVHPEHRGQGLGSVRRILAWQRPFAPSGWSGEGCT